MTTLTETKTRILWPFAGIGAGLLTLVAVHGTAPQVPDDVVARGADAVAAWSGDQAGILRVGVAAGFATVVVVSVFAAGFARLVEQRSPEGSALPGAIRMALTAGIASLIAFFGIKAVYAVGVPGAVDNHMYTPTDVSAIGTLAMQGHWLAYWGFALAAALTAVLSLRHRVLPRWFGWLSLVIAVFVFGMTAAFGLVFSAGLCAPIWLIAAGIASRRP